MYAHDPDGAHDIYTCITRYYTSIASISIMNNKQAIVTHARPSFFSCSRWRWRDTCAPHMEQYMLSWLRGREESFKLYLQIEVLVPSSLFLPLFASARILLSPLLDPCYLLCDVVVAQSDRVTENFCGGAQPLPLPLPAQVGFTTTLSLALGVGD